ncbi:MAG: hypothetical protein ACI4BB_10395 [Coprococcus sp.]
MDNYILMNDMIQAHQERMMNLKRYYPFFRLMDTGFAQYRDGRYGKLDMSYIVLAVLRFFIEYNHFQDRPVRYEDYRDFMAGVLIRDFDVSPEDADEDGLYQYIFDKMCNEGRPFTFDYFDPASHQIKKLRVRLIESELKEQQVLYRISADGVAFYLDTKEVREESNISIAQLLLEKMIKARNFKGGLEVIGRINMEVGKLLQERREIQVLLNRHVKEGLEALERYHSRLLQWFEEEQRLFASNMALSAKAVQKMEASHITGEAADEVYRLDTALKNAMKKHSELMNAYVQMQKAGDEALEKAKRTRFRPSVDFMDIGRRMIESDDPELLVHMVMPLLAPKIGKTFVMTKLDDLLLYKPEETTAGEPVKKEKEQMYVYEDELVEARMKDNFGHLLKVLLDQLKKKGSVTLDYMNYLYSVKFPDQILRNGDYYAFLVHLSQKDYYDLDRIRQHQDTFLEDTMAQFVKEYGDDYAGLKFRLIYLPDETIEILEQFEMSNIRFERAEG